MRKIVAALIFAAMLLPIAAIAADWQPTRPVEFVVASGAGGGTDIFARTVQSIVVKYKLMPQSIVVLNKGGGSGAEGFVYVKSAQGDPHKMVFGTNNEWMLPLVAKVGWKYDELTPVAAMAFDEFLLWTRPNAPWKTATEYVAEAKKRPGEMRMGGSQSKDTDEILTRMLEKAAGIKLMYVPFKSGGEAAVQLAGGHIDSNTNNPAENVGQWKGGKGDAALRLQQDPAAGRAQGDGDDGVERHPDLQGAGDSHRRVQDAAGRVPAGRGARRRGGLLRADVQEGERDAGVGRVHRQDVADRSVHGGPPISRPSSRPTRSGAARSTRSRAGS